jgi:hypothetical protein
MNDPSHEEMRQRATVAAQVYAERESAIQQNVALFDEAVRRATAR